MSNQRLVVNREFHASDRSNAVACAIEALGQQALAGMPPSLRALPQDRVPLRAFDTVGLPALRALLGFGVDDTAPAAHSLLLMDATGAYHRQMMREFEGQATGRVITPLMRLQDAEYTRIILVALLEVTPVLQAAALQEDLRRASIEPYAWVLNKNVSAAGTNDPLLAARLAGERKQIDRMADGLAQRVYTVPWLTRPPIGFVELSRLVTH